MWFFLIKAIAGSIIGAATESWFRDTRLGVWFYNKVDNIYTWAAKRYHIKLVTDEEKQMAKFLRFQLVKLLWDGLLIH